MRKLASLLGLASIALVLAAPVQADHDRKYRHADRHYSYRGHDGYGYRRPVRHYRHDQGYRHPSYYGGRYCSDHRHHYRPHYHVHPDVYASYYRGYPAYVGDGNLTVILTLPF